MRSDKLLENIQKVLQGKLVEANNKQEIKDFIKQCYESAKFNDLQMEEIREGFKNGLTEQQVKLYADPKLFNYDQMCEIRKSLENELSSNKIKQQKQDNKNKLKYDIEYYLNTATADRRETTKSDVYEDYCTETEYFDTDLEAFEYVMQDILEEDPEDWYEDESTDDEKIKAIIDYFEGQDYGDGSTIICKVIGKKYKYDSGVDIDYFLNEAEDDEDYDDEEW